MLNTRPALVALLTGALLIAIFAVTVIRFRTELRDAIHQKIVERDAAVLYPMAEAELHEAEADPDNRAFVSEMLLPAVAKTVRGMVGVAIYDADGNVLQTTPDSLTRMELSADDYASLAAGNQISRYHPAFPLGRYFSESASHPGTPPILEVLLPLHAGGSGVTIGFVKYLIDARALSAELAEIDRRVNEQTAQTLGIGGSLIALVLAAAYFGLARAQKIIAERTERLARANFELTLAAKTSALGVITSHLIHGLQGPVAGLRAMMANHANENPAPTEEWESAATYTDRMQSMIHETVALLGDTATNTAYELTGSELADTIDARNRGAAAAKGVVLKLEDQLSGTLDSHRGSLLCLITTNLVQNAIEATNPGRHVVVRLARRAGEITVLVRDEGSGIPDAVRAHLFEPGRTGRPGGTGLGLAISRLLARQIGAELQLVDSGPNGTTFRLSIAV